MDLDAFTPVQKVGDYFFKRDDLFAPFNDIPLNGGKVRQCIQLLTDARNHIQQECNSTVVTGTSMKSPQGIIVSRVAREFGFKSRVFIGGTTIDRIVSNPIQYPLMNNILSVGGELDTSASRGYPVLLDYEARKWSEINGGFHVKFGINLHEYNDAIVGSVSRQVQNLPDDLDALVVPVGSGIMFSGIIRGIVKYGKHVRDLIGIQISGKDLRQDIDEMIGEEQYRPYELEILKGVKYGTPMKLSYGGIDLDWLYESKAFWYMQSKLPKLNGKRICFWIVGNSTKVRT